MYFQHFTCREIFSHCSEQEIVSCVRNGCLDSLLTIIQFLDCFRDKLGFPLILTSTFRDKVHNDFVNGSKTSQHLIGQAVDFYVEGLSIDSVYLQLKDYLTKDTGFGKWFGQVIIYKSFIHIGLRSESHKNLVFYDKRNG